MKIIDLIPFVIYCAGMLFILFGRPQIDIGLPYWEQVMMNINLRPLHTISQYIYIVVHKTNTHLIPHAAINIFGNIVAFVPSGFFLPQLFQRYRTFFRFFTLSIGTLILIETIQLFSLRGCFDIDDIILNLIGGIGGYVLFSCSKKAARNRH